MFVFVYLLLPRYLFTFQSAGISADKSQYATVGVGAIMVTMTIVTIPLMDRLGRRTLHFVSIIFTLHDTKHDTYRYILILDLMP